MGEKGFVKEVIQSISHGRALNAHILPRMAERDEVMKHMTQTLTDNYNAFVGAVIAVLSMVFGEHWYLFALFLLLNIADWVTGWMKSRIMKKENSVKGWKGVLKKIGYWIMITFAFMIAAGLIEIGEIIGVDLQITTLLGWFVLASLIAAFLYSTNNDKP